MSKIRQPVVAPARPRVVIYIRVSDQEQVETGSSLDAQLGKCKDYAALHEMEVVEVLREEGYSAKSLHRPQMRQLLALAQAQEVDGVVIYKLDRLTRSLKDLLELVEKFSHAEAVADGVNCDYDIYRIKTRVGEKGETIEGGPFETVGKRDKLSRQLRWEKLDEDITYAASQLDRDVVVPDQIRTVITCFRDKLFTEIMPGRTHVPKTLIFAKSDSHADDIVQIVRDVFGKGNDFCAKITYKTDTARVVIPAVFDADGRKVAEERTEYKSSGVTPDDLLSAFRNSY